MSSNKEIVTERPTALNADVSAVLESLAPATKVTFLKAASRLLGGLVSYPAAWLRRPVQAVEDVTNARSLVSKGLAQALIENTKSDPLLLQAAAEVFLPDAVRKVRNKAGVASVAAEELSKDAPRNTSDPDDDWMNSFIRYAEDASSERLKLLYGKILAGEIATSGMFAKSTLRLISELTTETAADFAEVHSELVGDYVFRDPKYSRSPHWDRLVRLQSAGLLSPVQASVHQPPWDGTGLWSVGQPDTFMVIKMQGPAAAEFPIVNLTREGMQIGKLLDQPDFERNLRNLSTALPKPSVEWITLHRLGENVEALYPPP